MERTIYGREEIMLKNWVTAIIIIILLVGGGSWYFVKAKQNTQTASAAIAQTAAVQKGNLDVTVSGSGSVESADSEDVTSGSSGQDRPPHARIPPSVGLAYRGRVSFR